MQLACASKLLCACPLREGAPPNALTCPICAGHPGTLPTLNNLAVRLAVKTGLALNGRLNPISSFDRKHYRHPDLPKGYQVTQHRTPIVVDARLYVAIEGQPRGFGIDRIQIEEDSAKLLHREGRTLVDYNRAGVPLIELVGAPDLSGGAEAEAWLRMLHRVLTFAGITEGSLEKGQLRCDANVSLGTDEAEGTRVEIKNINSFRFVRRAIDGEIDRQRQVLAAGGAVLAETRTWTGSTTESLRSKETRPDYRFLAEPDLPDVVLNAEEVEAIIAELPGPVDRHLLHEDLLRLNGWRIEFGLEREQVEPLTADPELETLFREAVTLGADPQELAGWIVGPVLAVMARHDRPLSGLPLTPQHLTDLCRLVLDGSITRTTAKKLLDWVGARDGNVEGLVQIMGWHRISDPELLRARLHESMTEHPDELGRLKGGHRGLVEFFVGKVMTATDGRADPGEVRALVEEIA